MDKKRWTIAHDIAFDLVDRGTDPNELGKVIAFMRRHRNDKDAKGQLMLLVQRLANSRNALIRSRQTQRFYQNIQDACEEYLRDITHSDELLLILGWSLRLMRYYRIEPKRAAEEQSAPRPMPKSQPTQMTTPPKQPEKPRFKAGDRVNATILKKDGIKVTVRLQTDKNEEVVFEAPYYPHPVGKEVKLKVMGFDRAGKVSKLAP